MTMTLLNVKYWFKVKRHKHNIKNLQVLNNETG